MCIRDRYNVAPYQLSLCVFLHTYTLHIEPMYNRPLHLLRLPYIEMAPIDLWVTKHHSCATDIKALDSNADRLTSHFYSLCFHLRGYQMLGYSITELHKLTSLKRTVSQKSYVISL